MAMALPLISSPPLVMPWHFNNVIRINVLHKLFSPFIYLYAFEFCIKSMGVKMKGRKKPQNDVCCTYVVIQSYRAHVVSVLDQSTDSA